jgi:DNA-binding protein H-NS
MATLEQIQVRMKKLQVQAEAMLAKKAQAAVDQIRQLMLKHGLTTADIEAKAKAKREAKASGSSVAERDAKQTVGVKGKLPPKYLNPKTGETWSGHARPPAWIRDVKDRTKFLIDGAGTASPTKTVGASSGKTPVRNVQSKGALPPKYQDPKSGATWSGRGPAPKWLASAKDRSKFLVKQTAVAPKDASATRKATKSKAAPNPIAASKKVGTKKTVASRKLTASKKSASPKKATKKASTEATVTAKRASARKTTSRKVAPTTATATATATMPTPEAASTASA